MYVVTVETPRTEPKKGFHKQSYSRNLATGSVKAHSCRYIARKVKECVVVAAINVESWESVCNRYEYVTG
jgi:hypothetical protein